MNQKVVTNLRMDKDVYLRTKARAADAGMSLNEYFNFLADKVAPKHYFAATAVKRKSMSEVIKELAKRPYKRQPMGASDDDKAIYDIQD